MFLRLMNSKAPEDTRNFFIYQWSRPHELIMHVTISSIANMNRVETCMRC